MDGRGADDIVNGALGTRSIVEAVVGIVVGGMDGGCLGCVAVMAIDELSEREHGTLSADARRRKVRGHWCAGGDQTRCQG